MNNEIIKKLTNEITTLKFTVPVDGFEEIAEYRLPKVGEFIMVNDQIMNAVEAFSSSFLVLTPKLKQYDWSKTSGDCLVYLATGALCRLGDSIDIKAVGIYEGWQAITRVEHAPVDESAVDVEYRCAVGGFTTVKFAYLEPTQYRVIGLKDGCKY